MWREDGKMMSDVTATAIAPMAREITAAALAAQITGTANATMAAMAGIATHTAGETVP